VSRLLPQPLSTLLPYTTLFRSFVRQPRTQHTVKQVGQEQNRWHPFIIQHGENKNNDDDKKTRNRFLRLPIDCLEAGILKPAEHRSEEHTSELQSLRHLVCRLLL